MAQGWTLQTIRNKVRTLTGTPSKNQLSDSALNDYINNYYVFTMPHELKNQCQIAFIDFTTEAGVDTYDFPAQGPFLTNSPQAWADGLYIAFYQDPGVFFQDWPQIYNTDQPFVGDGGSSYPGVVTGPPIIAGTLIVGDANGLQVATDTGNGTFTGNVASPGTINYTTGAFTVNFSGPIATGTQCIAKYQNFVATRPEAMLFFEQKFTLRPVPDTVYAMRLEGFINPSGFTADANTPTFEEWGQCIAYGASFDVMMDRGDNVGAKNIWDILKRFETVALARTEQQYLAERSRPRF